MTTTTATRLEPLSRERAREVFEMMRQVRDKPHAAIAVDENGCVLGVVGADDTEAQHVLGDLDVHA